MDTLRNLYCLHSPTGGEKKMKRYIKSWIRTNVPDAVMVAENKNLYVTRGESESYPCLVSHMDQVQKDHEKDFRVYRTKDDILYGFSPSAVAMRGLGADDKNGIWVCLQALQKHEVMKCAFFWGEESGCLGSSEADLSFFDDCRWVIQCDRRGSSDFISDAGGTELCDKEFIEAMQPENFGYKETSGLMTDVMTLKDDGLKVACCNLSCGYYRPHTDEEYTDLNDLLKCRDYVFWAIENVTAVFKHEAKSKWSWTDYKGGSQYSYGKWDDYRYYGDGWDDYYDTSKYKEEDEEKDGVAWTDDEIYEYAYDLFTEDPERMEGYEYYDLLSELAFWAGREEDEVTAVVECARSDYEYNMQIQKIPTTNS